MEKIIERYGKFSNDYFVAERPQVEQYLQVHFFILVSSFIFLKLIYKLFQTRRLIWMKLTIFGVCVQELKKEMKIMVKKIDLLEVHGRFAFHYFLWFF